LALFAMSTFGARSGWLKSIPVSISPTSTLELPPVMTWASGVWIWIMSHCSGVSGSLVVAGVFAGVVVPSVAWSSFSRTADRPVAAASAMRLSALTAARNVALVEVATATPIASYRATRVPPALEIRVPASAGTARLW